MIKIYVYIILVIFSFSNCKDSACNISNGKIISIEKELENFSGIKVLDNINLEWVKHNDYKTIINGDENLIDQIELTIKDELLTIENKNTCTWLRDNLNQINIKLYAPSPNLIILKGNGSVISKDTITSNLRIENYDNQGSINLNIKNDSTFAFLETGSLDLTLTGESNYFYLYNVGYNYIFAKDFITRQCHINNNSWVTSQVSVTQKLIIEDYSIGEIQYWGNPNSVEVKVNKSNGKITNME